MDTPSKGSLIVVGTGISVSGQMTLITESVIKNADVVLAVVTQSALVNLQRLNDNTHCMRHYYQEGQSRLITYQKMTQRIIDEVREGKSVVAAFYGHPGVFVNPANKAITELRKQGFKAQMLPGISAEDCLFADLGLDPSHYGCQSYEATQFLLRQYALEPHMMQVIWQIGCIGEFGHEPDAQVSTDRLAMLRDRLLQWYPPEHSVILYEASTLPIVPPRIESFPLKDLAHCRPSGISTLVVPALGLPDFDLQSMAKLDLTPTRYQQMLEA